MDNLLANSIRNKPHLAAFDEMMADRFSNIDYSNTLMNLIDTCSVDALPYLAKQFNVLGYKGLRFATTEQERRDLIKKAIELQKYKGTEWSIKEALKIIGINECEFIIGTYQLKYDGTFQYNGLHGYAQNSWATFTLNILDATFTTITTQLLEDIVNIVNEYKSTRSKMVAVSYKLLKYDGTFKYDGTIQYNSEIHYI